MADNNAISSKYEDMDVVYKNFSRDLANFSKEMYESSEQIMATVEQMGEKWSGNGYDAFKENMGEKIDNIRISLDRCDEIKGVLDATSERIKIVLEKLKERE